MARTASRGPAPTISALDLDSDTYESLLDLELQVGSRSDRWIQAELARCFVWDWTSPDCGFRYWAARYWTIVHKVTRRAIRLRLNHHQAVYLRDRLDQNVILKDRKAGMSTVINALYYWRCRVRPNQSAYVMAHVNQATQELWKRIWFSHSRLPAWMKPPLKRSNAKELLFADNYSAMVYFTARSDGAGRAGDGDCIHLSEISRYRNAATVAAGIEESAPPGAWIDAESTPAGHDHFRTMYKDALRGESGRKAFFFRWWDDETKREPLGPGERIKKTEEEAALDGGRLDGEQIKWRRIKKIKLKRLFAEEHPEDDETCFLAGGNPRFDTETLRELLVYLEENVAPVDLRQIRHPLPAFVAANLTVWVPPERKHRYVMAADIAMGVKGGAYSVIGILDFETAQQCAEWHGHWDPYDFGRKVMPAIGNWYNRAVAAPEENNHGHATIAGLREAGYYPMFRYRPDGAKKRTRGTLGWPTNPKTKPVMIDELDNVLREGDMTIYSAEFVKECLSFRYGDEDLDRDEIGDEAMTRWSDRVMTWAIAWQVRKRGIPRK